MTTLHTGEISERWQSGVRLFHSRFWTILTFVTLTLFIVLVGTLLQTPLYQATATVLIDMEKPNVLSISTTRDESVLGQSQYPAYADYFQTQLQIITSRSVAEQVFQNLKLAQEKPYARAKDPIEEFLKQIEVQPVRLTRLVQINALDPKPERATTIANEFASVFVAQNQAKTAEDETLTLMKNEYLKLQSKEAELSKRYKAKFPTMVRVRQQMEQLAKLIEQETNRMLYKEKSQIPVAIALSETTGHSLYNQLQQDTLVGGLRPNNIKIVDPAQLPKRPAKPNTGLNLMLGLLFGLLGGIGTAVIEEMIDSSYKVPEDLEHDQRVAFLGYIPKIDGVALDAEGNPQHQYQYVQINPHTQVAEAYRTLRTKLFYATPEGSAKTMVITSPGSGEGKTTTSANLAVTLTHLGLKILLVDADLRRPRVHDAFGMKQSPGLSEFLVGRAPFEKVTRPTHVPGLWVTTSGFLPPNPAELLQSPQMKEFLKQASQEFDRVMIDSPPVIAVTDPIILASLVGKVVAVVQSGKTPRQAVYRLNTLCTEVGAKVLGVILNNVPSRYMSTYYGYSSYRYEYGYDESGKDKQTSSDTPSGHRKGSAHHSPRKD